MNILEYDKLKMQEDLFELHNITCELKDDISYLFAINNGKEVLESCDSYIGDSLDNKHKLLVGIYTELDYIIGCIEKSREKYIRCEDKIEDLLERIKDEII